MPISDPVFKVSASGVSAPTLTEVREYLRGKAQEIFGGDVYLGEDSADGQLIDIFAAAIDAVNSQAIAAYSQFSPVTAEGVGLDLVVKVNGISRNASSYSEVDLVLVGQAGTVITNGTAEDSNDQVWLLPATVTIPTSGQVVVTATAQEPGAVTAEAGAITTIGTPTLGWQTVTNPAAATPGDPVETDAQLRQRQTLSTMAPSQSTWEGLTSAILNLDDVLRIGGFNNQSATTNEDGIPAHSVALVVDGGDAAEIAETLWNKSSEGVGFYGSTTINVTDSAGVQHPVKFSRPTSVPVYATVTIRPTDLYTTALDDDIRQSVADFVNSRPIGTGVDLPLLITYLLSQGTDGQLENRYYLSSLTIGRTAGSQSAANIDVNWREAVACAVANVSVVFDQA